MKRLPATTLALGIGFSIISGGNASYAQDPQSMSCDELWYARNQIYAAEGYCFRTRRAQAVFGTSCISPYGRLKPNEERQVNILQSWEHMRRCNSVGASQIQNAQPTTAPAFDPGKSNGSVSTVPAATPAPTPSETGEVSTNETLTQPSPQPTQSTGAPTQAPSPVRAASRPIIAPDFLTPMNSGAAAIATSHTTERSPAIQSTARGNNSPNAPSHTDREYGGNFARFTSCHNCTTKLRFRQTRRAGVSVWETRITESRSASNGVDLHRRVCRQARCSGRLRRSLCVRSRCAD